MYAKVNILGDFQVHKLIYRFFTGVLFVLVNILFFSRIAFSDEQVSSGWLFDYQHPSVSVQMQLTGEKDPLLKTVNAVLQVQLQQDWKTYWRAPGEGGEAPSFDFSQGNNLTNVVWAWPAPKRYNVLGVDTLGYKDVVNFPLTLYVQDLAKPTLLKGVLTLPSCSTFCVLNDYNIELNFVADDLIINEPASLIYQQALASVPIKLNPQANNKQFPIHVLGSTWDDESQQLVIEVKNKNGWFTPDIFVDSAIGELNGVNFSAPELTIAEDHLTAKINVSSWEEPVDLNKHPLNITVTDNDLAVELLTTPNQDTASGDTTTLLSMFVIALLGGLILNIMPCVLPVLGMKLSAILSAGGIDRTQIRKQFIASSAGILCSFWLLAAFLLTLKLSGQALGWGIQFQNPYFIGALVVITALFAANMLDIFTIQLPVNTQTWLASKGAQSYIGHFLQGMFATLLATPCSAPFLGTAVAFSLAASSLQLFIIFSALGLGMALPWLLIAAFPAFALYLPKPGHWMNSLKTFFALLILMTSYWLLSLLIGFMGLNITLTIAVLLTVLLLFLIAKKRGKKLFIIVLASLVLTMSALKMIDYLTENNGAAMSKLNWQPLDSNAIDLQVKQGKIVFVDITANWCVTCKANKIAVLLQDPVDQRLQEKDVIAMRGDWTIASDKVTDYLRSYGRVAVPFNIVYGPNAPQGIVLPTILTSKTVLSAIKQAKGDN